MLLRLLFLFDAVLLHLSLGLGDVEPTSSGDNPFPFCLLDCTPEKGVKGFPGTGRIKGEQGEKGHRGPEGIFPPWHHWHVISTPGPAGKPGRNGGVGEPGPKGITGVKGHSGPTGQPGSKGDPGQPGVRGNIGSDGSDGTKGIVGDIGEQGERGAKGLMGELGDKGETGQPGIQGDSGSDGVSGDSGERGKIGNTGLKGDTGDQGETGYPGTGGSSVGEKGAKGFKGQKGTQGIKGNKGRPGTVKGEPGSDITNVDNVLGTVCNKLNEGQMHYDSTTEEIIFCDGDNWKCAGTESCCTPGDVVYIDRNIVTSTPLRDAADIVLIVDDSGSMREVQDWIPSAAEALEGALRAANVGNNPALPNKYFVVLFGNAENFESYWIENRTSVVKVNGKADLAVQEVRAAMNKFRRRGNAEDGYQAIEVALSIPELRKNDPKVALNIALISDEPRDPYVSGHVAGTNSRLEDISEMLVKYNAKLNYFGNLNFESEALTDIAAVDYTGKLYSGISNARANTEGFESEEVQINFKADDPSCRAFVQYAPLAMATDGALWDLLLIDKTKNDATLRARFTEAVARIKVLEIVNQSSCFLCNVTCVGSDLYDFQEDCTDNIDQIYCRCRATGKPHSECKQRTEVDYLQTIKYDYSPLYKNCAAQRFPTHYEGWCDRNWPFLPGESHLQVVNCLEETSPSEPSAAPIASPLATPPSS